jgi:hypothetical protein
MAPAFSFASFPLLLPAKKRSQGEEGANGPSNFDCARRPKMADHHH